MNAVNLFFFFFSINMGGGGGGGQVSAVRWFPGFRSAPVSRFPQCSMCCLVPALILFHTQQDIEPLPTFSTCGAFFTWNLESSDGVPRLSVWTTGKQR